MDLDEVATKIQAGYKGMVAREEMLETDSKLEEININMSNQNKIAICISSLYISTPF